MRSLCMALVCSLLAFLSIGCALGHLDSRSAKEEAFEFQAFFDRGPSIGPEDPANPGYDADGNKIPPPEVAGTYTLPPLTAGLMAKVTEPRGVTPTVGIKLFDAKLPYVRWFDGQLFGGADLVGFYCGKRWTSIYEVTTGFFVGYGFDRNDIVWGIGFSLSKF